MERYYLEAEICNQTVKQDKEDTSGKHEATIAMRDQRKTFAFARRDIPGLPWLSHKAMSLNSSSGVLLLLSIRKNISSLSVCNEFNEVGFFDLMLFKTVCMCIFRRGSVNSFACMHIAQFH